MIQFASISKTEFIVAIVLPFRLDSQSLTSLASVLLLLLFYACPPFMNMAFQPVSFIIYGLGNRKTPAAEPGNCNRRFHLFTFFSHSFFSTVVIFLYSGLMY